jgi:hypothetical protein
VTDELLQPDDPELDALVFEFLERAEAAPARWREALEELGRRVPARAAQLRQRVEMLVRSGLWGAPAQEAAAIPERLGEFRLLRKLGGGGMGVVYLAEQESVGRRVALKLIRGEHLYSQSARARFVREARATARLDHASIVRVFTIGEEAGMPFLAMEYVPGTALDALLDHFKGREPASLRGQDAREALLAALRANAETPLSDSRAESFERGWIEFAVRIVRDIALALEHAHERGVLHRDVKPSNVLLGADGRVRLCDFGLAALAGGESLTRSGAQLGSLPYMAPEQLRGEHGAIGPQTDVYGLGVTLYELVTLARPFGGESEERVRQAILDARPTSMRTLNVSASADIEIVCAKALDPDPRRRYSSAADFARDLSNVLELRPIEARPPSAWTRARRWSQRRPAAAVAVVAGALLMLAFPLGWELNRMRTMDEVRAAYKNEQTAREQSERDFRAALQAVGHVLRGLGEEDLRDAPRMQRLRLKAIERAQDLFSALERDRATDAQLLSEGADLYAARADVLFDLGRVEESIEAGDDALELLARLSSADPQVDVRRRRAFVLSDQAKAQQAQGKWRESLVAFEQVLRLVREFRAESAVGIEDGRILAITLANIAEAQHALGDYAAARERLDEAVVHVEPLVERAPDKASVAWAHGRVQGDLGDLLFSQNDLAGARPRMELRLAEFRRAAVLAPGERFYRFDVVSASISLAGLHAREHDTRSAETLLLEARAALDRLLDQFPDAERYVEESWRLDQVLGALYGGEGRVAEALEVFRASAERVDRTLRELPERADIVMYAAQAEYNLALARMHSGASLEETEAALDKVQQRLESPIVRSSGQELAAEMLRMCRYNRALARCFAGDLERAQGALRDFELEGARDAQTLRFGADLYNELILALRRQEPDAAARADRERGWTEAMFARLEAAVEAGYADTVELDSTPALESFRSEERFVRLRARCAQLTQ